MISFALDTSVSARIGTVPIILNMGAGMPDVVVDVDAAADATPAAKGPGGRGAPGMGSGGPRGG